MKLTPGTMRAAREAAQRMLGDKLPSLIDAHCVANVLLALTKRTGAPWRREQMNGWSVDGPGSYSSAMIVQEGREQPVAIVVGGILDDAAVDEIAERIAALGR